ncbi:hypothetical protein RND71_000252 [Anisodus tanguticus]|uniref:TF-B3 domain-containing protein n=1 Tax=Anisodus tanguticus TaxID=243964 RepID=A0AAE1SY09_9SOLA|nr:hypothetical protein RND71_000252 [Anisodus tanguticus]
MMGEFFVRDSCFVVGDACVFEADELMLKVHIFRAKKIPTAYTEYKDGKLPRKVSLKDRFGNMWPIGVTKAGRSFHFQYGWEKFIKENNVEFGDFMIFDYDGNVVFDFKLLGITGCEKKGAGGLKLNGKEEDEEEMNVEHQKSEVQKRKWPSDSSSSDDSDDDDENYVVEEEEEEDDEEYDVVNEEIEEGENERATIIFKKKEPRSKGRRMEEEVKDDDAKEEYAEEVKEEEEEETEKVPHSKHRHVEEEKESEKAPRSKRKFVEEEKDDEDEEEKYERESILKKVPRSKRRFAEEEEDDEEEECDEETEEEEEENQRTSIFKKKATHSKFRFVEENEGEGILKKKVPPECKRGTVRKMKDFHDQFGKDIFRSGHATQPKTLTLIALAILSQLNGVET